MSLIEGIGDEVTLVFAILFFVFIVVCAWLSTHTRDIPFFRLLIVDLTRRRNASPEPTSDGSETNGSTSQAESVAEARASGISEEDSGENVEQPEDVGNNTHELHVRPKNPILEDSTRSSTDSLQAPPASETVFQPDTDIPVDKETLRQRRLEFLTKEKDLHTKSGDLNGVTNSGNVTPTCGSQTVLSADSQLLTTPSEPAVEPSVLEELELDDGNIRVKLKYLNETQRLVQSNPTETIGQFKRNHFGAELADNKLVRLIFNGQCLQNDTSTLESYNIRDNCTVHCLVTEARQQTSQPQQDRRNDIDISIFMFPLFAFFLVTVWYFRLVYRQYFNAMATFSLAGITFLFSVALFSTWRARHGREEHQHLE